jgi:hypothetical protein
MSEVAWFKIENKDALQGASVFRTRVCRGEFHLEDGRYYRTHWMQYCHLKALLLSKGLNPTDARKEAKR